MCKLQYSTPESTTCLWISSILAMQFTSKTDGWTRAQGFGVWQNEWGSTLRDFAAIGDSHSDLAMFELAGFRAAVANACQELKDVSDFVAQARYGEGFAEIVGHMIKEDML